MNTSVALHTLGCKLNFAETSSLTRMVEKEGFTISDFDGLADVYVINTCSVTENADKECRMLVRRIKKRNPDANVLIMGCYAQLKPAEIMSIDGVDAVLGANEKFNLVHHIKNISAENKPIGSHSCEIESVNEFVSAYSMNDRTRTFLKIQDGCDYPCTYCTIPKARGKSRSDSIQGVLSQVIDIANEGIKEVVLTGVNIGDFGKRTMDSKQTEENFLMLLQKLDLVPGIERYRISSIEPNLLTDHIIDFVAQSQKIMPHFHIPLQSGSNRILGLMKRRYRRELYADRVTHILRELPHAGIGVDVIVGFPSESDADFQDTYDFLASLPVSYLHVFTYSERPGTQAINIAPIVPIHIRKERNRILRELSLEKSKEFAQKHSDSMRPVLFEKGSNQILMQGYTDNYIKVEAGYKPEWVNEVVEWLL